MANYYCNACADSESIGWHPCRLSIPAEIGGPEAGYCPVNKDECEWCETSQNHFAAERPANVKQLAKHATCKECRHYDKDYDCPQLGDRSCWEG